MFENLTKEAFTENLNTTFSIPLDASETLELELVGVVGTLSTPQQEQFSITFRGPLEHPLPQATYHMEHEKMGPMDLFIVPSSRDADGFRYEAVFNYLLKGK